MFINPKTDFAFKKIFGSEESKNILISFLDALLYQGKPMIEDLEIITPYVAPRIRGLKDSYLDVRVKLSDDTQVIVEMQVLNHEGFEQRILFNAAKTYSTQLLAGEQYSLLNPVIALTITDFRMFDWAETMISRFILKEKDYLMDYPRNDIELVFVELPKFTKSLEELETLTDKWIFFLKHASDFRMVPDNLKTVTEIQQAFTLANKVTLTPEELHEVDQREWFLYDMKTGMERKAAEVAKKAAAKAAAEGEARGEARGKELGAKEATIAIARSLLDVLDLETISQRTGLSLEELQQLSNPDSTQASKQPPAEDE